MDSEIMDIADEYGTKDRLDLLVDIDREYRRISEELEDAIKEKEELEKKLKEAESRIASLHDERAERYVKLVYARGAQDYRELTGMLRVLSQNKNGK